LAATAADVFVALYRLDEELDLSKVRIHTWSDVLCRSWGARALTIGSDIHFRTGEFAPSTREGFWLLAHEVAHVVQQRRGPVSAVPASAGFAVGRPDACEEEEANAAADAALVQRQFTFASPATDASAYRGKCPVMQRYMSWEHLILGDAEPKAVREAVREAGLAAYRDRDGTVERLAAHCALLEELGRDPENVDPERLKALYPSIETLQLPGSGLVVTLGELNILPDYLSGAVDIESAPARFVLPLVQTIREWNLRELRRIGGNPAKRPRLRGAMRYPGFGRLAVFYETIAVDRLGQKCGIPAWEAYSSVVGRNAAHFAPFSWYRWQSFHLTARELIRQASDAMAGPERETLRARARLYAGYADHFLQDSFAAGHLINKTLIMQWYIEWLTDSRFPLVDRKQLASMTFSKQPYLHGPGHYFPVLDEDGERLLPSRTPTAPAVTDPQTASEAVTLGEKIEASGVIGADELEQRVAFPDLLKYITTSQTASDVDRAVNAA
jgi:hypothetical protein